MLYQRRTFTVPAGGGTGAMCREKGHSASDARGKCLCCGEKIAPTSAEQASTECEAYLQADADPLSRHEPLTHEPLA